MICGFGLNPAVLAKCMLYTKLHTITVLPVVGFCVGLRNLLYAIKMTTMITRNATITVRDPSPIARPYTKQGVPSTVQPAVAEGGAVEDGIVESRAVLLLETLGVSTGLWAVVVA